MNKIELKIMFRTYIVEGENLIIKSEVGSITTINLKDVLGVTIREPRFLNAGYLHFTTHMNEHDKFNCGKIESDDIFSIALTKKYYPKAIELKAYIDNFKQKVIIENDISSMSIVDELNKFKKLLDDGIINQDEFDKQKNKLLS